VHAFDLGVHGPYEIGGEGCRVVADALEHLGGTSHAYATPAQIAQAAENRKPSTRPIQPHSIGSRCIAALRDAGEGWTATAELVELVNRHRPEHCTVATLTNIYTALKAPRKRGMVESRPSETVKQGLEWRISK
jgi:hypothetical protein